MKEILAVPPIGVHPRSPGNGVDSRQVSLFTALHTARRPLRHVFTAACPDGGIKHPFHSFQVADLPAHDILLPSPGSSIPGLC